MNTRERFVRVLTGQPVDRAPFMKIFGGTNAVLPHWRVERPGLEQEIDRLLGFEGTYRGWNTTPVNFWFSQCGEREKLSEDADSIVYRSTEGTVSHVRKTRRRTSPGARLTLGVRSRAPLAQAVSLGHDVMNVNKTYRDLGSYSDWVREIDRAQPLYPMAPPGLRTRRKVRAVLGFHSGREFPRDIRAERRWTEHGIAGEEISWDVGYGPRTKAWLLRPAGVTKPLPGILALHDHGGFKYYGKEKIADDDAAPNTVLRNFRNLCYGGRPFANDLAGEGFAVLVHDVFLWGSRKFEYDDH